MKKRILAVLLSALILANVTACNNSTSDQESGSTTEASQQELQPTPAEYFEYTENEEGGITITKYIGKDSNVVIPDAIEDKPVTQIGIEAFRSNLVVSLKMPDSITKIGGGAFDTCDKLEEITVSNNLESIGAYAFHKCEQLKHMKIPSKVRYIGDQAFTKSGLETLEIENGIEEFNGYATFAATQLKQIVLPPSVKLIGNQTFAGCPNLESVILNEGLVTIDFKAFCANPKLKGIVIPKTVTTVTDIVFTQCSRLEKVMFEGDAPSTFKYSDSVSGVWEPYDVHFTVYYHENAQGFTSPEWYGYPTANW